MKTTTTGGRLRTPSVDYETLEPTQRLDHLNESIDGHWMSKNEDIETIDTTFGVETRTAIPRTSTVTSMMFKKQSSASRTLGK